MDRLEFPIYKDCSEVVVVGDDDVVIAEVAVDVAEVGVSIEVCWKRDSRYVERLFVVGGFDAEMMLKTGDFESEIDSIGVGVVVVALSGLLWKLHRDYKSFVLADYEQRD